MDYFNEAILLTPSLEELKKRTTPPAPPLKILGLLTSLLQSFSTRGRGGRKGLGLNGKVTLDVYFLKNVVVSDGTWSFPGVFPRGSLSRSGRETFLYFCSKKENIYRLSDQTQFGHGLVS